MFVLAAQVHNQFLASLVAGFFTLAFLGVAGLVLVDGVRGKLQQRRARRWLVTQGKILNSSSWKSVDTRYGDNYRRFVTTHFVDVRYEYRVGNERFEGSSIDHGRSGTSKAGAEELLRRYPVGKPVVVYYDRTQPRDSVLEQSAPKANVSVALGSAFGLLGLGMLFFAFLPLIGIAPRLPNIDSFHFREFEVGLEVFGADQELGIQTTSTPYQVIPWDEATSRLRPTDRKGPANLPHYGIGGFFRFESSSGERNLAKPGRLVLGWKPEDLPGFLDPALLAIYYWDDRAEDWKYGGGTLDLERRQVVVRTPWLGEFTLAPPMPAGYIRLSTSQESAESDYSVNVGDVKLNTGEWAPDGTCLRAVLVDGDTYVDGFLVPESEKDRVTHGIRASLDRRVATLPVAKVRGAVEVWSCEGTAFGRFELR